MTSDITALLIASQNGNRDALDQLVPLVYDRLRALARAQVRRERADHTLDSVALVHEAYLKLVQIDGVAWQDRAHFFATVSRMMRRILVDYAHKRSAAKRQAGTVRVALDPDVVADNRWEPEEILAIDEALTSLEAVSPRGCQVFECRCFGGLSIVEAAAALKISPATAKRDLQFARAWLARAVSRKGTYEHGARTDPGAVPRGGGPDAIRAPSTPGGAVRR